MDPRPLFETGAPGQAEKREHEACEDEGGAAGQAVGRAALALQFGPPLPDRLPLALGAALHTYDYGML